MVRMVPQAPHPLPLPGHRSRQGEYLCVRLGEAAAIVGYILIQDLALRLP